MTDGTDTDRPSPQTDSDQPVRPAVDRAAAFADTSPPVPRTFVYWLLGAAAVLGLGGLLLEHLFSSAGLNPAPHRAAPPAVTSVPAGAPVPGGQRAALGAALGPFMGLTTLRAVPAAPFSLINQAGQTTTLSDQAGKVVVLTFFNGRCNDICPVVSAEIRQADADLGANASEVEFLTVNTDPTALSVSALAPAVAQPGLAPLTNWHMLTGPLDTMNAAWKSYGISISVVKRTGVAVHNDIVWFIDSHGQERYRATPFGNETTQGTFTLPATQVARWGAGIAAYADKLVSP
jgi:protein SCO1/2